MKTQLFRVKGKYAICSEEIELVVESTEFDVFVDAKSALFGLAMPNSPMNMYNQHLVTIDKDSVKKTNKRILAKAQPIKAARKSDGYWAYVL